MGEIGPGAADGLGDQQFPPAPREAVPGCDSGVISTTKASNRGDFAEHGPAWRELLLDDQRAFVSKMARARLARSFDLAAER